MEYNFLPLILVAVGAYFLVRLRFFFILHPFRTALRGLRSIKDKRAFRSFSLALAGTLGVGNVFGVALGILVGGAGCLFWLSVSMLFAMVIKYAEVVITGDNLYHDRDTHGGIFYVIRSSFGAIGRPLSMLYALLTLSLSLVLGAALQTNAIGEAVVSVVNIPRASLSVLLVFLTLIAIMGGAAKIEKITAIIIPLTTIIYIFITFTIILLNISSLEDVIKEILRSALRSESALGGGIAFLLSAPVREGFARGILSNEAGAGTSSMAHSRSGVLNPASAGILGILEVWFDTGLICMLTGLSILLSVPDLSLFTGGMELVMYAVGNVFGVGGKWVVLFSVFAFAFATVICWFYYGSESWSALFGKRKRAVFMPLFLLFVILGCYLDSLLLLSVTDALMLVATLVCLIALIKNSDRITYLSEIGGVLSSDRDRLKRLSIKGNGFLKGAKRR